MFFGGLKRDCLLHSLQFILGSERCPRPDKVRPQHRGLRPLLLSNSEWVL